MEFFQQQTPQQDKKRLTTKGKKKQKKTVRVTSAYNHADKVYPLGVHKSMTNYITTRGSPWPL